MQSFYSWEKKIIHFLCLQPGLKFSESAFLSNHTKELDSGEHRSPNQIFPPNKFSENKISSKCGNHDLMPEY